MLTTVSCFPFPGTSDVDIVLESGSNIDPNDIDEKQIRDIVNESIDYYAG